jgi:uncharacterized membrane-anchored protein YhcB (DUF1043 family)
VSGVNINAEIIGIFAGLILTIIGATYFLGVRMGEISSETKALRESVEKTMDDQKKNLAEHRGETAAQFRVVHERVNDVEEQIGIIGQRVTAVETRLEERTVKAAEGRA